MKSSCSQFVVAALIVVGTAACSSTRPGVDRDASRSVIGTRSDVRVTAEILTDRISSSTVIPITCEIENDRAAAIAIADRSPVTTYDRDSRTVTINLGSEVPGNDVVPRLVKIVSGEKKVFEWGAKVGVRVSRLDYPRYVRIRLNFLEDTAPFETLIGLKSPRSTMNLPADLLTRWIESNAAVETNAVPLYWGTESRLMGAEADAIQPSPAPALFPGGGQ